jgi:general secretion pathway protein A
MENCENSMDVTDQSWVYFNFYKLKEPPFSITPDPEFLFSSQTHQNVIEKILYGIKIRAGFILLSGEVGTGKTTICRSIIDTLNTDGEIVYIINPSLSGKALISNILDDLGMQHPPEASKKDLINQLNNYLLNRDRHKPVVIIIDDAQTMPVETLEDLRLLSNLETDKEKMLQMLIVGQPEIEDLLSGAEMRQLKQRIFVNCRLEHLNPHEVEGYINRRLFIAGSNGQIQFSQGAKRKIVKASRGIPRLINKICDYALTASYVAEEFIIRKKHVKKALKELGDLDFKNKIFFRGVFGQTIIRTISLLFAVTMSVTVILAVFFTPILEKPYRFLVDNIPRPITDQNLTMVNTKSPGGNQVSSGMLVDKNSTVVDKALSNLFPAAKMDISPQTSLFNFEKKSNGRTWIPDSIERL